MSDAKKVSVVKCWMYEYPGTTVVGVDDDERKAEQVADGKPLTPAVAVPVEAYREVRQALLLAIAMANFNQNSETEKQCREALALLPEVE